MDSKLKKREQAFATIREKFDQAALVNKSLTKVKGGSGTLPTSNEIVVIEDHVLLA